jgi:hypothetical protein
VLARAVARRAVTPSRTAALIAEVFAGRPSPPLPASVLDALERLDAARARDGSSAARDR